MGRLGSSWFQPPKHVKKDRRPLPTQFERLVQRNVLDGSPCRIFPDLDKLRSQIESLEAAFQRLESGKFEDIIPNTKLVVKQAFELTQDGVKLPSRLQDLGWPVSQLDVREIRQIGKIANYWRISRHLAICSRRFRAQFASAEWRFLPNFSPSTKSKTIPAQFVHAEIQLLVHYEVTALELKPRAIGVSKEACFLCDSFIRAHGRFVITGAHRQVFPQWTVPDLEQYTPATIRSFQQILSRVCAEVEREYLKSQQKTTPRPIPAQSAINLDVIHLDTPSTSTLPQQPSASLSMDTRDMRTHEYCGDVIEDSASDLQCHDEDDGEKLTATLSSALRQHGSTNDLEEEVMTLPVNVVIDKDLSDYNDWLHIVATSAELACGRRPESEQHRFVRATVTLTPVTEIERLGTECPRTVHVSSLSQHHETLLERGAGELYQLLFLLVGYSGQKVCVLCEWHIS